jgi:cytidine deaminase
MTKAASVNFEQTLTKLPPKAQYLLRSLLEAEDFCGVISASDANKLANELDLTTHELMISLIPYAQAYAKPFISKFWVGEVGLGLSGDLYFGCNIEFIGHALSFSVQGEQSTTINAWIHGEQGIQAMALPAPPCGYCRQFLYELATASDLQILTPNQPPMLLRDLLPNAFGPEDFGVVGRLMQSENHNLILQESSTDPVVLAALSAANMSYAPYSKSYAGVALSTADGKIYQGPYAESAAFNPSMSPIQAALSNLNFCGQAFNNIQRAVLVETLNTSVSQLTATRAVLSSISGIELEVADAKSA